VYENGYHGSLLSGFYCEDEGRSSRYLKAPYVSNIAPRCKHYMADTRNSSSAHTTTSHRRGRHSKIMQEK
jgi:hypothetical protein